MSIFRFPILKEESCSDLWFVGLSGPEEMQILNTPAQVRRQYQSPSLYGQGGGAVASALLYTSEK